MGGVPGRLIKWRFDESIREKLVKIDWPSWDDDRMKSYRSTQSIRSDVLRSVIDQLEVFHAFLNTLPAQRFRFYSSSIFVAFEGDTNIIRPSLPIVKLVDLQHVFDLSDNPELIDNSFPESTHQLLLILQEILQEQ